jgi:hypothetical protein
MRCQIVSNGLSLWYSQQRKAGGAQQEEEDEEEEEDGLLGDDNEVNHRLPIVPTSC